MAQRFNQQQNFDSNKFYQNFHQNISNQNGFPPQLQIQANPQVPIIENWAGNK